MITREITVDNDVGNYTAAVAAGESPAARSPPQHTRGSHRARRCRQRRFLYVYLLFVGWAVSLARPSAGEEKADGTAPEIGGVASGKPVFSFGTESPSTASAPASASSSASEDRALNPKHSINPQLGAV